MQHDVAARAIDLLNRQQIVAEHPAVAAAGAVDDDDVGRQPGDAGEALPVDVVLEADLVGEGGALPCAAADIAGEFGERVDLQADALRQQAALQPAPVAEKPLRRRRVDRLGRRQRGICGLGLGAVAANEDGQHGEDVSCMSML